MTGYIFVPLYVEQAKGESLEAAIDRTEFDEVWAVLQAMQEQDDVLDDRIHYVLAAGKKTKGFSDAIIRQRAEITGPAVSLDKLRRAISVKCLDRIGRHWDTMVQQLLLFKKRYGHLCVPRDAKKPWRELPKWVWLVRQGKRLGTLSAERIAELEAIGFDWHLEGETLDDTSGLLNETQFKELSGLRSIPNYRRCGLIRPVGFTVSHAGLSPFYHPRQIKELKKKLGITLDDTTGLLNEAQFEKVSGLSVIFKYRKRGLIKPLGFALATAGLSRFYHPRQIKELKKKLGVTLDDTTGLLIEKQFKKASGLSEIREYRKRGLIKPVGFSVSSAGLSPFYHPRQIKELKKKLGVTLGDTTGLLNEHQFKKASGLTKIGDYRKRGLIRPVGFAVSNAGLSPFYHPRQIKELKKKLGITLTNTTRLLNEKQFRQQSGISQVTRYRKDSLIKPVGWAMTTGGRVSPHYHPRQIRELKAKLKALKRKA